MLDRQAKRIWAVIRKLANRTRRRAAINARIKEIDNYIQAGLPKQMKPALEYLVSRSPDSKTIAVIELAEGSRREIASMGDKKISIMGSRKGYLPGQPVEPVEFTMERIASTGKNQKWGTVLYLIARGFKSSVAIELGTCAGISAIYLSSAPNIKMLITVEGSKELADLARETLKSRTNVKVINAMFDEAFDSQFSSLESKVDLAFIDGHHEKTATINYFDRLAPFLSSRAVVVFDDISWSDGMRDAWNVLSRRPEFAHCIDLGAMGVCVTKKELHSSKAEPRYWDMQPILKKR
jgi:predicted O-methyltransferase YrrM